MATGAVVDPEFVAARERQARIATYGKLAPSLHARLQHNPAERVPVAIWVALPDPGSLGRGANPDLPALAARVRAAQTPAAEAARALGAVIKLVDLVPVLFAELSAGQISGLAQHPAVVAIDDIPQHYTRLIDDAATSNRYPFVWSTATGTGTKIAVHEDDGVDNVNPFVNNATHPVLYWSDTVGLARNIDYHATGVAGVIASTHNWRRGGAFGISQILSANFGSPWNTPPPPPENIVNSASWAISNGADTIYMSWGIGGISCAIGAGASDLYSRWVDYLVKTFGINVVVASGNTQCGTPGEDPLNDRRFVLSPGLGWNTISVGSYFDNNTGLRSDDVFSCFTSFRNPRDPNSGRTYEKPDVVGMGGTSPNNTPPDCTHFLSGGFGVETTGVGGGVNDSRGGTSFAAPDVAALTALVISKDLALRRKAEAVKAIIMAGATHNIIDGTNYTSCPSSEIPNDCRDGAGAIDAYQTIQNVVVPGNWRFPGLITPASFDANGNLDFFVYIDSGKDIRVVIAWDSTATCSGLGTSSPSCVSDVLNADLHLILYNPYGNWVARAESFQNSAEVIDYRTELSGTYMIRVHRSRFNPGTNTYLGVAWNLNTRDTRHPLTGVTDFTLNTTRTGQTTDKGRSFWDTYSGPGATCGFLSAQTGLEKVYRITTPSTGQITARLSNLVAYPGVGSNLDVMILRAGGTPTTLHTQVIACGSTTAMASGQPAGTYYVVIDGRNGSVAQFALTVNFAAGTTVAAAQGASDLTATDASVTAEDWMSESTEAEHAPER